MDFKLVDVAESNRKISWDNDCELSRHINRIGMKQDPENFKAITCTFADGHTAEYF